MWTKEQHRAYLKKYNRLPRVKNKRKEYCRKYYNSGKGLLCNRRFRLGKKYGITIAEYNQLVAEQNGVCACCGGVDRDGAWLSVDHDHETGKIRGLLCKGCNTAIGGAKDSVPTLLKMVGYLLERG